MAFFRSLISPAAAAAAASGVAGTAVTATATEMVEYTPSHLAALVERFIARSTIALQYLHESNPPRSNRPVSTREAALRRVLADENEEFDSGFWIPDLGDGKVREDLLGRWDGGWVGLGFLRFVRVSRGKDGEVEIRESRWPPNWES